MIGSNGLGWSLSGALLMRVGVTPSFCIVPVRSKVCMTTPIEPVREFSRATMRSAASATM